MFPLPSRSGTWLVCLTSSIQKCLLFGFPQSFKSSFQYKVNFVSLTAPVPSVYWARFWIHKTRVCRSYPLEQSAVETSLKWLCYYDFYTKKLGLSPSVIYGNKIQKNLEKIWKILLGFCFRKWRSVRIPDFKLNRTWIEQHSLFRWKLRYY